MSEFVVSAKPFAAIPMNGRIRRGRWGMKIIKTPASVFPYKGGPSLESSGLKPGDRIVAVNGKAVPGASFNEFREMWLYGEIGESVKLIVQGSGKDESVFREVTVKRIRYPILPQTNGTRTPGDATTATGAQDSSAP